MSKYAQYQMVYNLFDSHIILSQLNGDSIIERYNSSNRIVNSNLVRDAKLYDMTVTSDIILCIGSHGSTGVIMTYDFNLEQDDWYKSLDTIYTRIDSLSSGYFVSNDSKIAILDKDLCEVRNNQRDTHIHDAMSLQDGSIITIESKSDDKLIYVNKYSDELVRIKTISFGSSKSYALHDIYADDDNVYINGTDAGIEFTLKLSHDLIVKS